MKRQKPKLTRPPVTEGAARTSIGGEMESPKNSLVDTDKNGQKQEIEAVAARPAASPPQTPAAPGEGDAVSPNPAAESSRAGSEPGPTKTTGPHKADEPALAASDKPEAARAAAGRSAPARLSGEDAAKDAPAKTEGVASRSGVGVSDVTGPRTSTGTPEATEPKARVGAGGVGKPPQAPVAPVVQRAGKSGPVALFLSLVALLAVAVLGWQLHELRKASGEIRQEVAQRLSGGETAVAEVRALVRQNNEGLGTLQGRFGALESQVGAMEGQAATLELLYRESSRSRGDQVLAELEQAITIAGQQLQLAGNFEAALIALQGAEARLAAPEFAHLQPLRRALVRDIEALKAHPQVDVSGIALRLELVLERIDSLPLAFEVRLAERASERELESELAGAEADLLGRTLGYARALGADIWSEVRGMVRLERLDHADPALLGPEQSNYLRENVKIRLLTARLALLARDARTFAADIERAREWLERYFDGGNDKVRRTHDELGDLAATPIRSELPTLTDTFAALRLLQARGAVVEAPASPESGADEAGR